MPASESPAHPALAQSYDAVLFDLDGTLIDSTGPTERAWIRWADEEGLAESYEHLGHGMPAAAIVAAHVPERRVADSLARAAAIELQETAGIVVKAGVASLLEALPSGSWAIVTSCTSALAAVRMEAAGLVAPEVLITFDSVHDGKPHPEGFLLAAAQLGVAPERCLVVEDTPAGLEAGRRAGCTTLGIAGTYPAGQLKADHVLASLEHVDITLGLSGLTLSWPGSE